MLEQFLFALKSEDVLTFSPPSTERQHGANPCLRPQREQGMSGRVALLGLSAAVAIGAILLHRYRRSRVSRGSRFDAIVRDPVAAFLRSYDLKTLSATEFIEVVQSGLQTPASLARALAFVPRPGDVVTLTTPKTVLAPCSQRPRRPPTHRPPAHPRTRPSA